MKIKEVIAITGLTDRAIRLYIEHGLLFPDTKESYSGRRNIEFSDADVEKLQNISLLRRAGFSISQIKALDEGGEEAESVLREFIAEKRTQHELDGKILEALYGFSKGEAAPTIENVAAHLTDEMLDGTENADLKPSRGEHAVNILCWVIVYISVLVIAFEIMVVTVLFPVNYRFPVISSTEVSTTIIFIFPLTALLSVVILILNRYKKPIRKPVRVMRTVITVILVIVLVMHIIMMPLYVFAFGLDAVFDSKTTDPSNYLELDDWVDIHLKDDIYQIFPVSVPKTARNYSYSKLQYDGYRKSTEYYYYLSDNVLFSELNIYAQWCLAPGACEQEQLRYKQLFPDAEYSERGDYVCMYIKINTESEGFFAYNTETSMVRYGYYWSTSGADIGTPYYETVDWE